MRLFVLFVSGFLMSLQLMAQSAYTIKPENADCNKPLEIKDTIFGPTNAPSGFGSIMEISGDKTSLYAFEKEHNTCWYFFKAKYDALLQLEIIPVNSNDDYDFILYKYSGKTFCKDVAEKKVNPVRSCISRNDKKIKSRTGLSNQATEEFIHSGPGASFSKSLRVKKGEIYYLVTDNVYPKGSGHTVILHYSEIKKTAETPKPEVKNPVKKTITVPASDTVIISVLDKETRQPVKSNLKIYLSNKTGSQLQSFADSVSFFMTILPVSATYVVKTDARTYFDNAVSFKTCACGKKITLTIELSRIKVGQNVVFDNILFYGNEARILPESKPALEVIATTMKRNPSLHIEVQGHVNCPTTWSDCDHMEEHNMQLSINRAKAVYDYLNDNGIDTQRMTFKGYGATKMIYPDARSEDKMKKNRRVEILVTGFE